MFSTIRGIHLTLYSGKKLAILRQNLKLSQNQLANHLHISRSYLSNLETTNNLLSESMVLTLSNFFNISPKFFENSREDPYISQYFTLFSNKLFKNDLEDLNDLIKILEAPIYNLNQEFNVNLLLASYYFKIHDYPKALAMRDKFLNYLFEDLDIDKLSNDSKKFYYFYLIEMNVYLSQFNEGFEASQQLNKLLTDKTEVIALRLTQVYLQYKDNHFETAFLSIQELMTSLKTMENDSLLAEGYTYLSTICISFKLYNYAIESLEELELCANRNNFIERKAMSYQQRGYIYSKLKDYSNALIYHKKALELMENSHRKIPLIISIITNNICLKNYNEAKLYLACANDYPLSQYEKMILLAYKGELALYEGNIKFHKKYYEESLAYFLKHKYIHNLSYVFGYLANYYYQKNKYKKAAEFYKRKENLNYEET